MVSWLFPHLASSSSPSEMPAEPNVVKITDDEDYDGKEKVGLEDNCVLENVDVSIVQHRTKDTATVSKGYNSMVSWLFPQLASLSSPSEMSAEPIVVDAARQGRLLDEVHKTPEDKIFAQSVEEDNSTSKKAVNVNCKKRLRELCPF